MEINPSLQKLGEEIMIFMRGKYSLDEIGNSSNELCFKDNDSIILTIRIFDDHLDFIVDGQCIPAYDTGVLDSVKNIIHDRKEPNRNSFPRETAILSDCGHRCDLCVHYTGASFSEEFRTRIAKSIMRAYNTPPGDPENAGKEFNLYENFPPCDGCAKGGIGGKFDCVQMKCAAEKNIDKCINCSEFPCEKAMAGLKPQIHTGTIFADDVTWAILPFVYRQYGN